MLLIHKYINAHLPALVHALRFKKWRSQISFIINISYVCRSRSTCLIFYFVFIYVSVLSISTRILVFRMNHALEEGTEAVFWWFNFSNIIESFNRHND